MVASLTELPVIGVPILSSNSLDGWDSLLSIVQMPAGVPVAAVAVNGAKNAGVLAARILGAGDPDLLDRMRTFMNQQRDLVLESAREMEQ
jgi:5-(carboxyamino)imidazole ribonucleotide mutase